MVNIDQKYLEFLIKEKWVQIRILVIVGKGSAVSNRDGFPFRGGTWANIDVRPLIDLKNIQEAFSKVPLDTYVTDNTRFKDLCRFRVLPGGVLVKASHGALFHPINAESYGQNNSRWYEETPIEATEALQAVAEIFSKIAHVEIGKEILLQRQRVVSADNGFSKTVREGAHRDGVEKLAILCVNRENVRGGVSFVYTSSQELEYACLLQPGEMLFIDDSNVYHDATPIRRQSEERMGYRDILILTSPSCRGGDEQDLVPFEATYFGT